MGRGNVGGCVSACVGVVDYITSSVKRTTKEEVFAPTCSCSCPSLLQRENDTNPSTQDPYKQTLSPEQSSPPYAHPRLPAPTTTAVTIAQGARGGDIERRRREACGDDGLGFLVQTVLLPTEDMAEGESVVGSEHDLRELLPLLHRNDPSIRELT